MQSELHKNPQSTTVLYLSQTFPSIPLCVGTKLMPIYGCGRDVDIQNDTICVFQDLSWRLAEQSMLTCYLSMDLFQTVCPLSFYEMLVKAKLKCEQEIK